MSHPYLANVIFRPSKMKLVLDKFLFQMAQQKAMKRRLREFFDQNPHFLNFISIALIFKHLK